MRWGLSLFISAPPTDRFPIVRMWWIRAAVGCFSESERGDILVFKAVANSHGRIGPGRTYRQSGSESNLGQNETTNLKGE